MKYLSWQHCASQNSICPSLPKNMYLAIAGVAKRVKEEGVKSNEYRGLLIGLINTESFIKLRFFFDGKMSLSATLFFNENVLHFPSYLLSVNDVPI